MKPYAAVVTEYNPFHFGHRYQLDMIKSEFGSCVCVMSSFAVQRGELALFDKYSRARAALDSGADLVLELPFPWCSAGARDFAAAGVSIAFRSGAEYLAFGVQSEPSLLYEIARLRKTAEFEERVQRLIKSGISSYPRALCEAVLQYLGRDAAECMQKPNNILAVEYLMCLPEGMKPYPVMRDESFLSASEIRESEDVLRLLPKEAQNALASGARTVREREDVMLLSLGRRTGAGIYGDEDGLRSILQNALSCSRSACEVVEKGQNASYTASRIRRYLLHSAFSVSRGRVLQRPAYTVLLASDSKGREILKNSTSINVVTKPADGYKLKGSALMQYKFAVKSENTAAICYDKAYSPLKMKPYIAYEED